MWQRLKDAWAVLCGHAYAEEYPEDMDVELPKILGINRAAQGWWLNGNQGYMTQEQIDRETTLIN